MKFLFLISVFILSACSEHPAETLGKDTLIFSQNGEQASVRVITTTDNTKCILATTYKGVAITCDWNKQ